MPQEIIKCRLTDAREIAIVRSAIVSVVKDELSGNAIVYCTGSFPNATGVVWAVNMVYEDFIKLIE